MTATEVENLTQMEDLFMEALVARVRSGEQCWTFDKRHLSIAQSLDARGYVLWKPGVLRDSIRVFLTDLGRDEFCTKDYLSPIEKKIKNYQLVPPDAIVILCGETVVHGAMTIHLAADSE